MTIGAYDKLLPWIETQERFERVRGKWRGVPVSDLAYPNPMDAAGPPLVAMRETLSTATPPYLQYTPYGGMTVSRRLVSDRIGRGHDLPYDWRDIILTPGAMAALTISFRMMAGEGAEIVVPVPCWLDYPLYLAQLGIQPVLVPMKKTFRLDIDAIARALGPATRAVVLSQPGNPSGVVYSETELRQLADAIKAKCPDAWIISDECHRDWVFSGERLVSAANVHPRTLVTYSFGKAFLMQGQRIGYVAVSPNVPEGERASVRLFLERACRFSGFCTPTALMQATIQRLAQYMPQRDVLGARHARVKRELTDAGYEVVDGTSTFFLYMKSPMPDAFAFIEMLAGRGVFALPSDIFHQKGYFRLALTATDEEIDRGLAVLREIRPAAEKC